MATVPTVLKGTEELKLLEDAVQAHKLRPVRGITFCFTGTMSLKRSDMERLVRALGGQVHSMVSGTTNFLVIPNGKHAASSKFMAARRMGVTVIQESEFVRMIEL
jgi:DNA ligase (NAD+)